MAETGQVTGDFALTAASIAQSCGIFTQEKVDTFTDLEKERPLDQIEPYRRKSEGEPLKSLVLSGSDL
jgi:magnesium-transporting ATPase (P-type)